MRRRVLLLVVGMTVLVVLAFAIPLAIVIRNDAYDRGVSNLQRDADDLASYLRAFNSVRTPAQITARLATVADDRAASVQLPSGTVLGTAPPGGLTELPTDGFGGVTSGGTSGIFYGGAAGGFGSGPGGGPVQAQPKDYRGGRLVQLQVPAFGRGGGIYTVRMYAGDGRLRSGETGPWLILAAASIGLLLLGVLLGELLTRRIVRPLVNTSETAQRLAAGDVTARATTSGPREVADVGRALNRLADRIDQLIAEERETVADLSHRLRTPLTALRLDAEALREPLEAERVGSHVTTLERMLTAVIHAARRPQREGRMPSSDATSVVAERVAFWSALAEDQGRAHRLELPDRPLPVRAGAEDLAAAVDALLENVIAHTPEGTPFAVALSPGGGSGARLVISDDGPGLPPDAAVRGRSDRGSSGLGLDIARRCAEFSGGAMTLASGTPASGTPASGTPESGTARGAVITLVLGAP